jgi:hypothetical protein
MDWRLPTLFNTVLIVIALVGGAFLWSDTKETSRDNAVLICSLGELVTSGPVAKRPDETDLEFRDRFAALRKFVRRLGELDDCEAEHPRRIEADDEGRESLERTRGGDRRQPGNSSGQQPGPPAGGPSTTPNPDKPSAPKPPPEEPAPQPDRPTADLPEPLPDADAEIDVGDVHLKP